MKGFKIILLITILTHPLLTSGQQDPQYSQYMFNPLIINPAYAGSREVLSAVLLHRSQWVGFDGAPTTQSFAVHAPLRKKKIGLGFGMVNDRIGPTKTFQVFGAYAYRLRLWKGQLAFALRTGLYNYRFDWRALDYKDPNEVFPLGDVTSNWLASFDFGMYYHTRTFYAGVAINHINRPSYGLEYPAAQNDSTYYGSYMNDHSFITVGKAIEISKELIMKPSIVWKTANLAGTSSVDFNLGFLYDNRFWFGVSGRTRYGLVFMTEYNITDRLRAGYAFDLNLNRFTTQHSGSHEIFIGIDLDLQKSKVLSPRYF